MTAKHKCSGRVLGEGNRLARSSRVYKCFRNATVERDGKWYCWQHDPIRVEADKKKRRAARLAKMDGLYARRARDAKLAALVTEETAALLERLAWWLANNYEAEDDGDAARALAAHIREALALEASNA